MNTTTMDPGVVVVYYYNYESRVPGLSTRAPVPGRSTRRPDAMRLTWPTMNTTTMDTSIMVMLFSRLWRTFIVLRCLWDLRTACTRHAFNTNSNNSGIMHIMGTYNHEKYTCSAGMEVVL